MDDYIEATIFFEAIFDFLHHYYFSHAIFGRVYLASHKIFIFTDQLNFGRFNRDKNRSRPFIKHQNWIEYWPILISQKEAEAFL